MIPAEIHSNMLPLHAALGVAKSGELVSIVGGGGKSALLFALAERAPSGARWVLTTTTRMFASQIALAKSHCMADSHTLARELEEGGSGLLVIGAIEGDKAVGVAPDLPAKLLAHPRVDCVALEADGSRRLPAKAPAAHEPVIAEGTSLVVVTAGIDVLDGTIADKTHRPELVAKLTGCSPNTKLRPADLATLLAHDAGGLKGAPAGARIVVLLNKVETPQQRAAALEAAEHLLRKPRIGSVAIGALESTGGMFETLLEA